MVFKKVDLQRKEFLLATENVAHQIRTTRGRKIKCSHHWVISGPEGPVSSGSCKNCGAKKEFSNSFEGSSWGSDISLDQIGKGDRYSNDSAFTIVADNVKSEEAS